MAANNDEFIGRVLALHATGMIAADIAKALGCTRSLAFRIIQGPKAERDRKIIAMRAEGMTYSKIGAALGIPSGTIAGVVQRRGQPKHQATGTNRPWTREEEDRVRRYVANGVDVYSAAKNLHRTCAGVRDIAQRLGCPFPRIDPVVPPEHLSPADAHRNYAAVAGKLEAGLRDPRNNVADPVRPAKTYNPARFNLAQRPRGRELNIWLG